MFDGIARTSPGQQRSLFQILCQNITENYVCQVKSKDLLGIEGSRRIGIYKKLPFADC